MRKLFSILTATGLLFGMLGVVSPAAAVTGNCSSGQVNLFTGMESTTSNPSQSRSGTTAIIDLSSNQFNVCNNYPPFEQAGPSAWVAISPKDVATYGTDAILQIGIVECVDPSPIGACLGENNPRFMWAQGGCAGDGPIFEDLGPANTQPHTFAIWKDANLVWHLNIDGAAEGNNKHKTITNIDFRITCWINAMRKSTWIAERWDAGDSSGSNAFGVNTLFTDARFGVFNGGFQNPNFFGGLTQTCHFVASDDHCVAYGTDNIEIYTAN